MTRYLSALDCLGGAKDFSDGDEISDLGGITMSVFENEIDLERCSG